MTEREAIDIIKSECYVMNLLNLDRTRMINTALDVAIKALEDKGFDQGYHEGFSDAVRVKKVIRPNGEWRTFYSPGSTVRCSECWKAFRIEWNFCPNCGADMRGEDDDE